MLFTPRKHTRCAKISQLSNLHKTSWLRCRTRLFENLARSKSKLCAITILTEVHWFMVAAVTRQSAATNQPHQHYWSWGDSCGSALEVRESTAGQENKVLVMGPLFLG